MHIIVEIAKDNDKWNEYSVISEDIITQYLYNILMRYNNFAQIKECEISILLTDNARMKNLNNEFRKKNSATNVLSFPDLDINYKQIVEFEVNPNYIYLGDIAFGFETIASETILNNISFMDHFKHLLIHSILHLLGYDHVEEQDAVIMRNLEVEILKEFNIQSPY